MLEGVKIVVALFCITLVFSIPLGVLVALLRLSKNKIVSAVTSFYILIMRGTPLLLQMIVIFYGLPLFGIVFDRFTAGAVAFVLNYTAYFAEIFRGGLQSIDKGQFEAADVLGFDKVTMYKRIILPQVVKRVLAPISNEVITLVKDTSLVYILGINDILRISQIAMNRTASLMPLFWAGAIYLAFVAVLTKLFEIIEKKYSYYR
ncbi:amino acid ABC transporter permease [Peptacetobacter hominis]|uniref:Amino acid ABC transporter permease n=1 Tax=Peptacetobacter hominis TaxID=2743610 RepID=A0A544QX24_9FIRM|nr:amino acid ABC transporter permease [Peptacetobacter hominis]TQQ85205.1 amino acid ABC transporter permease [Peptacetobacter hominis]